MILSFTLPALTALSVVLLLWQWIVARRFPLHRRIDAPSFAPGVTLFKPLKGCDAATEQCLRSWLTQEYDGQVQVLFGVAAPDDPACDVVRRLTRELPGIDAQLIVCASSIGANAKVSALAELERHAAHEVWVISDADVRVPPDFLRNAVAPLRDAEVGLANCFYRLANLTTLAMHWEAVAVNADFWSQVLQARSLKPLDFALGAAMVTRRSDVAAIGGFRSLADCLADDYQLGNRIARQGRRIELCPVIVECWGPPLTWRDVWKHQLRWARTIRVCQPVPYFFSILSNVTLWALLWLVVESFGIRVNAMSWGGDGSHGWVIGTAFPTGVILAVVCVLLRIWAAGDLQRRLVRSCTGVAGIAMVPVKDLFQAAIWFCAFTGNTVEWRGRRFRLRRDGTLARDHEPDGLEPAERTTKNASPPR